MEVRALHVQLNNVCVRGKLALRFGEEATRSVRKDALKLLKSSRATAAAIRTKSKA